MLTKLRQALASQVTRTFAGYAAVGLVFVAVLILAASPFATSFMKQWSRTDVETRSKLVFNVASENLSELLAKHDSRSLSALFERIAEDKKVLAVGFCDAHHKLRYPTKLMPAGFSCDKTERWDSDSVLAIREHGHDLLISAFRVPSADGQFIIVNDLNFAKERGAQIQRSFMLILAVLVMACILVAAVLAFAVMRRWVASVKHTLRNARLSRDGTSDHGPFEKEVRQLLRQLEFNRRAIEEDATAWNAAALRRLMKSELAGTEVLVVSNREPYIHNRDGGRVEVQLPASGLVSALEPVMRACGGTWIAHGSGSADRDVVDAEDHIRVPPEFGSYTLRRIWLSDEEQDEYYYGLANEGLWPLCHIAFVRPTFRLTDWQTYKCVNERFADAVVKEARSSTPIVLVQDYHFALLPALIRKRLPHATVITFWHIPWPNSETFGICPWKEEIVQGLLGSSILGFHTQFHCNNFLETVDRFVESRIDREHASVTLGGHETMIRPYPISIEWPPTALAEQKPVSDCRAAVFARLGLSAECRLTVGVERFDYTKGIVDRIRAVDAFLTEHPEWKNRFVLYQAAAPTRSKLASYRAVQAEAQAAADEVNAKHGDGAHLPVVLSIRHHDPREVFEIYRAADACLVSSLHDGMNLVAKEFVAARDDKQGVLVLSSFAGASRELSEALIVNPYNAEGMGAAIEKALTMPAIEQRERMHLMREMVRARNVYRWAGQMLLDAARLRQKQRVLELATQPRPETEHALRIFRRFRSGGWT